MTPERKKPMTRNDVEVSKDIISDNLDSKVKETLNKVAGKVRERAKDRGEQLYKDMEMLVVDFLRDYQGSSGGYILQASGYWEGQLDLRKICSDLANKVAEVDVERCFQNMSAKILELDKK
jgi:hypothetical protein